MNKQIHTDTPQLAYMVSPACPKHSVSGKPGRMVNGIPAKMSFAGVIWESPIPRDSNEATFFNQAVCRMTNAKNHQQKETDHPAKTPPQCQHERTFMFYPELVTWQNNGKDMGPLTHGAKIAGCMQCGKTIASNYAE